MLSTLSVVSTVYIAFCMTLYDFFFQCKSSLSLVIFLQMFQHVLYCFSQLWDIMALATNAIISFGAIFVDIRTT